VYSSTDAGDDSADWVRLYNLRPSELLEAYGDGDSPVEYADFLTTEWDLYGAECE
jgi:hypothetical protein